MQPDDQADIVIGQADTLPVVLIDRQPLYDPNLSWTAVGVLIRLRADSQPVRRPAPAGPSRALEALAEELCEGRPDRPADVLDALNELIGAGYLKVGG